MKAFFEMVELEQDVITASGVNKCPTMGEETEEED